MKCTLKKYFSFKNISFQCVHVGLEGGWAFVLYYFILRLEYFPINFEYKIVQTIYIKLLIDFHNKIPVKSCSYFNIGIK